MFYEWNTALLFIHCSLVYSATHTYERSPTLDQQSKLFRLDCVDVNYGYSVCGYYIQAFPIFYRLGM